MVSLPFKNDNESVRNALCISETNDVSSAVVEVLSESEMEKYHSFHLDSVKLQFLLGRYSAKKAFLKCTLENVEMRRIEIKHGAFEQPVLNDAMFDISIALIFIFTYPYFCIL